MGKSLIIAEKPSVAADIAKALGGFTRTGEFFESDDYVLSSAVGHLVEIAAPEQFEVKRGKWSFAHLPVIPPHFDVQPIAKNEERLKLLARLIRRKDVDGLINACDAGREGELIFRLISQYAKAKQPVRRLWLQSMTPASIRDAFKQLRDDQQMMPLADAARCRSEADWLVGINGTRAMTAFNSRDGGFYLTTVGRVQTPTLAIVVDREERIRKFVSRDYFEIRASFQAKAGVYEGRWFDPQFKKGEDAEARAERLWERPSADAIAQACKGQPGIVNEEAKPSTQIAPQLFDLTSLQREANGRFGFSAKTTLSIAQALYEKHKVLTYPRTDARALPEDYIGTVKETLSMLQEQNAFAPFARQILANEWVRPNKRVFDNTKISDHFAIIPTLQAPRALSDAEQRIYDLVVRRFLSVFFPAAEYLVTTRITEVQRYFFKTEGRVMVNAGWLAIYSRSGEEGGAAVGGAAKSDTTLVPVDAGEKVFTQDTEVVALATRPPARYNEGTLLSAMEGAGKLIEDDELREAMAEKGLGTPATRAAIIEGLIAENYLLRDGRDLLPTTKAFQLLTLLRGLGVEELTMPELTGNWEYKLSQMERGRLKRDEFMDEIAEVTRRIVERAKNYQADTVPGDYATLAAPCPKCGAVVQENYKRFACTKCDFSISKIPGSRQLDVAEAETLLTERTLGPLQGFRSRLGRPFAAILKLTDEHKLEFDFGQSRDDDDANAEPIDFSAQTSLGACPKCGSNVYDHGLSYVCEKSVGPGRSCDFRSGKIILQQEIAPEQMRKLLSEGKTDLLLGFVSSRTRRKFKAFLVRGADGKVSFEFTPRPEKSKAGAKAAAQADGAADGAADGEAGDAAADSAPRKRAPGAKAAVAAKPTPAAKAGARKAPVKAGAAKAGAAKSAAPKKAAAKKPSTSGLKSAVAKAAKAPAAKSAKSPAARAARPKAA
ncbi:MAG TPA: DNA topoisomerase III [Burkholderiaceae bacterium]|nr:DNA topoisomerase III [Burkholderiaceae bacterium]